MSGRFKPRLATWPLDPVLRKLRSLARLSEAEELLVRALSDRRERFPPGADISRGGPRLVVAGWAAMQQVLPDGRRQIFRFALPGDLLGPVTPPTTYTALSALETVSAGPLFSAAASGDAPALSLAISSYEFEANQLLLDHVVRLGQRTAYERVCHFLLELQRRLQIVGLGDAQRFPLPLTQETLADILGLSIVHVNRTLQQLRREGLIELRSGVAILLKPETLRGICGQEQMPLDRSAPTVRRPDVQPANRFA